SSVSSGPMVGEIGGIEMAPIDTVIVVILFGSFVAFLPFGPTSIHAIGLVESAPSMGPESLRSLSPFSSTEQCSGPRLRSMTGTLLALGGAPPGPPCPEGAKQTG